MTASDAGLCWHSTRELAPRVGGCFIVAIVPPAEPKPLRTSIETLVPCASERAALVITPPQDSPKAAQEAQLIAKLLGV